MFFGNLGQETSLGTKLPNLRSASIVRENRRPSAQKLSQSRKQYRFRRITFSTNRLQKKNVLNNAHSYSKFEVECHLLSSTLRSRRTRLQARNLTFVSVMKLGDNKVRCPASRLCGTFYLSKQITVENSTFRNRLL